VLNINKKAIALSVNFIVWLILALVVFGMGLTLFGKFFQEAENIKQNLDDQTRSELQARMMSSPEPVVIYPTQMTIRKGRGDVFGVGILNLDTSAADFIVTSTYQKCYDKNGNDLLDTCYTPDPPDPDDHPIGLPSSITRTIESNKRGIFDIPLRAKADIVSGKYSVQIQVDKGPDTISTNLIYINVP